MKISNNVKNGSCHDKKLDKLILSKNEPGMKMYVSPRNINIGNGNVNPYDAGYMQNGVTVKAFDSKLLLGFLINQNLVFDHNLNFTNLVSIQDKLVWEWYGLIYLTNYKQTYFVIPILESGQSRKVDDREFPFELPFSMMVHESQGRNFGHFIVTLNTRHVGELKDGANQLAMCKH
jgi:hypothetical protein